jgi:hypothetical protein
MLMMYLPLCTVVRYCTPIDKIGCVKIVTLVRVCLQILLMVQFIIVYFTV